MLTMGHRGSERPLRGARDGTEARGLRGCGAEAARELLPEIAIGAGGGQVQHDAADRGLDPGAELQEPLAQAADLQPPVRAACGAPP